MSKANAAKVFNTTICTVPFKDGEKTGTCLGDSGEFHLSHRHSRILILIFPGGALIDPVGLLLGITSWGVPCALGYPDVYTRIDFYHDWIDSVVD